MVLWSFICSENAHISLTRFRFHVSMHPRRAEFSRADSENSKPCILCRSAIVRIVRSLPSFVSPDELREGRRSFGMLKRDEFQEPLRPTILRSFLRWALRTTLAIRHPTGVRYHVQSFKFMDKLLKRQTEYLQPLVSRCLLTGNTQYRPRVLRSN